MTICDPVVIRVRVVHNISQSERMSAAPGVGDDGIPAAGPSRGTGQREKSHARSGALCHDRVGSEENAQNPNVIRSYPVAASRATELDRS